MQLASIREFPGDIDMTKSQRVPRDLDAFRYEAVYLLELARGSSHIASTLSAPSMSKAVSEVMNDFIAQRGREALEIFRELLATRLQKRDCAAGAEMVRRFGSTPAVADAEIAPVSRSSRKRN